VYGNPYSVVLILNIEKEKVNMLKDVSDQVLANNLRNLRNQMRPIQNELVRRGYTLTEVHGHRSVGVTGFENMRITKQTEIKL
jgi:hypothetical protein